MIYPSHSIPLLYGFVVLLFAGQSIDKETVTWGESVEGVQCAMRLAGRTSEQGVPLLLVDVRNTGTSYFTVGMCEEDFEVRVDGKSHRWLGPTDAPMAYLPPGRSYTDIIFDLSHEGWWFDLSAGKHTVQAVAVLFSSSPPDQRIVRGKYVPGQPLRVLSKEIIVELPKPIIRK